MSANDARSVISANTVSGVAEICTVAVAVGVVVVFAKVATSRPGSVAGATPGRLPWQPVRMCRNIRTLHNFEPPATPDEVQAAALQYVRKISGASAPSAANQAAFERAVAEVAHATRHLLEDLVTTAAPKDRETEAAKARARSEKRFARS
jgi:hypothetical protein